jgi:hypothetical protein
MSNFILQSANFKNRETFFNRVLINLIIKKQMTNWSSNFLLATTAKALALILSKLLIHSHLRLGR